MKNVIAFVVSSFLSITCLAQNNLSAFPLSSVQLLNSPFRNAQETDLQYMLQLDPDRLLAPFLKEAGIQPIKENYGNWESSGLDGHMGGHYLSALSNMYAATGNQEVLRRLHYMISWIDSCQRKNGNGYVSGVPGGKVMWQEISEGKMKTYYEKWVPLYNIHKLFAGLRDAYLIAGNQKAKEILIKLSDWFIDLTKNLSDDQFQQMLKSEQGGINEVFADVAAITGDHKYLIMAKKLSHKAILSPLLENKDSLNGLHANTQIPKVTGFKRISEIDGDTSWANAAAFFWNTVVQHRTVSIGGNSVREHFNPATDFSSMIDDVQGPETCNTYNMLRLTEKLFLSNPKSFYIDYYERAVFNHILSSENPKGGFVYFTPMRPRHYRVYSQPQECFWCCVGTGMENHGKYGELIYAHDANDLFVNLFIASKLQWKEKGVSLIQQTKFPYQQTSLLKFTMAHAKSFGVHIRYPSWVKEGQLQVTINGQKLRASKDGNGFVVINRTWKTGDIVSIRLPMQAKIEYLPDGSPWASFVYGPIVLAAKTDTSDLTGLKADGSRMGHVASGPRYPIDKAPMIVSSGNPALQLKPVKGEPLHFTAANLIYPSSFKNLTLQPFSTIHDARYMIYWRVTDEKGNWGDQGNGTYVNPVLPADYSDLDAIRVGEDYYAISSTMQFSPGMVVLHSKDLLNWEITGHVVDDLTRISPQLNWDRMNCYGKGIWAGSIRHYKNRFWVYFGTPDDGFFMSSATDPAGPWEPVRQLWNVRGWDDCCSFCDDDGQLYFIATNFAVDPKNKKKYNIHLFKMTPDGRSLIMESDSIIHQSNGSEANKLYKINGLYYHYFSEVKPEGRVIMMERSKNVYGPWEIRQLNHVDQRHDREPNQGGLLQTPTGKWYFLTHHGSGAWEGRPASLLPVHWIDGWPVIGEPGADTIGRMVWTGAKPISGKRKLSIQSSDEFSTGKLNVQWEWNYQPRAGKWSLTERSGFLRLYAFTPIHSAPARNKQGSIILRAGNTLTQRSMRTFTNVATVKIDISHMADGQFGGLTHFSTTSHSLFGVKQENGIRTLIYDNNGKDTSGIRVNGKYIWLRSTWDANGISRYAFSVDGQSYKTFGNTYQLTWGSYRGDRIGIFNFNTKEDKGYVDVDWFRYDYRK